MSLKKSSEKKTSKAIQARELALKYKDLPYREALTKIREEVPTSKTTAHNAIAYVRKQQEGEKAVHPSLTVVEEEKKEPAFLSTAEKEEKIEEIKPEPISEKAPSELQPEEIQEQLDFFRDMLRGVHVLIVSKDGILGEKYGRSKEQCVQVSDQLYRYLRRRVSVEEFEKYDTLLLAISYITLVGNIAADIIKERRKTKPEKKEEKKP